MRISAFIFILILLISCTNSPEVEPQSLEENCDKVYITPDIEEELDSQFNKGLEYVHTRRPSL